MIAKFLRLGALLLAMAAVLVLLYGRGLWAGHDQHSHGSAAPGATPPESIHSHAAASGDKEQRKPHGVEPGLGGVLQHREVRLGRAAAFD